MINESSVDRIRCCSLPMWRCSAITQVFAANTIGGKPHELNSKQVELGIYDEKFISAHDRDDIRAVRIDLTDIENRPTVDLFFGKNLGVPEFNPRGKSTTAVGGSAVKLVLVLDASASMAARIPGSLGPVGNWRHPPKSGSRWVAMEKSANEFLKELAKVNPEIHVGLATFGGSGNKSARHDVDLDDVQYNAKKIKRKLREYGSSPLFYGTDIGAGIEKGLAALERDSETPGDKIMLLLTDGQGGNTAKPLRDAVGKKVTIHTVLFGTRNGASTMIRIAKATGGKYVNSPNVKVLELAFDNLIGNLPVSFVE